MIDFHDLRTNYFEQQSVNYATHLHGIFKWFRFIWYFSQFHIKSNNFWSSQLDGLPSTLGPLKVLVACILHKVWPWKPWPSFLSKAFLCKALNCCYIVMPWVLFSFCQKLQEHDSHAVFKWLFFALKNHAVISNFSIYSVGHMALCPILSNTIHCFRNRTS